MSAPRHSRRRARAIVGGCIGAGLVALGVAVWDQGGLPWEPPPVDRSGTPSPIAVSAYAFADASLPYEPLAHRIPMPAGCVEVPVEPGSFGEWLRYLPMLPEDAPVVSADGATLWQRSWQSQGVINMDPRDLQECADVVLRLRAEYLLAKGREDDIEFGLTSSGVISWQEWKAGVRPAASNGVVVFRRTAAPDDSRASFDDYLHQVFAWCGTISLASEGVPASPEDIRPGDFLSRPIAGASGHAVLIADAVIDTAGRRYVLIAQGAMPAQSPHIAYGDLLGAWVEADPATPLTVPGWRPMEWTLLRRFE